jgi:hypothetical protein
MATVTRPLSRGMATFGSNTRRFFVGGNAKSNGTVADVQVRPLVRAAHKGPAG